MPQLVSHLRHISYGGTFDAYEMNSAFDNSPPPMAALNGCRTRGAAREGRIESVCALQNHL